jgi:hypothetical protein
VTKAIVFFFFFFFATTKPKKENDDNNCHHFLPCNREKKKALAVATIAFFTITQPKAKKEGDNSCRQAAVTFFITTKVEKEGEGGSLPSSSYSRSRFKLSLGSRFKFLL